MEELQKAMNDETLPTEVRLAAGMELKRLLDKELNERKKERSKKYGNFGARLKYLRTSHAFTQKEFAELVGVSSVTISLWETGKTEPRAKHWKVLKDLLPEL